MTKSSKLSKNFDANLIVIGAGSAGLISSYIASAVKSKVILIEREKMGGDCLNTGCVPSKALISASKMANIHKKSHDFGVLYDAPKIDGKAVFKHIHDTIKTIEPHDSVERYNDLGVNVVIGNAHIIDKNTVQVGDKTYRAKKLVIASGASPFVPPIEGIKDINYLTSDTLWNLKTLPKSLGVLGGGAIGCELAQSFARLGVRVTQIESAPHLLVREDSEVQKIMEESLRKDGVEILTNTLAERVRREGKNTVVSTAKGEYTFEYLLVATGRKANVDGFGLENLDLEFNSNGTIKVNEYLQTKLNTVYAIGDVAGPYQFTHTAGHQAWYATVNALFGAFKKFKVSYKAVPAITFTDPEVARVGMSETEVQKSNIAYDVSIYYLDDLDRAIADKDTKGFVKVLTKKGKDKILGATIVGSRAGEMLAEFTLAMQHDIGLEKILGTIHPYPSYSDAVKLTAGKWKKMTAPKWAFPILKIFHKLTR